MFNPYVKCGDSYGKLISPAELATYEVDFTDLFVVPTKGRPRKSTVISQDNGKDAALLVQIDRVRPLDFITQAVKRPVYIESPEGIELDNYTDKRTGKKVYSRRTDCVNVWTHDDELMVNALVERLTYGNNLEGPVGLPNLAKLFENILE